jgi:hypothetical protein
MRGAMSDHGKIDDKRILHLIRSVREMVSILPGDQIRMIDESPAIYLGSIEAGDLQVDYLQLHVFRLSDGIQVILHLPALNRSLGKYLY